MLPASRWRVLGCCITMQHAVQHTCRWNHGTMQIAGELVARCHWGVLQLDQHT
jgi:hypothetical protein